MASQGTKQVEKQVEWIEGQKGAHSMHSSWKQFQTFIILKLFASLLSIFFLEHDLYSNFSQQRWEAFLIFFTSLLSVSDSNCHHITSFPNIPGGEMSFPPKTKINTRKTSYHYSGARHINYLHFYLYCQFLPMIWLFVSKFKIILKFLPNQNQTFLWTISSPCITTVSVSSFFATCVLK